ncbi:MAG TPA: class I tRNA ligase family protein, partial [Rhizomicrobium sp.]|nr:class I tRNA ligase family protein [Rhizomicrobium sp.]
PWTIPGNRAIAFSPDISYGLYQIADAAGESLARAGEQLLLADTLAEQVAKHAKMMLSRVRTVGTDELKSLVAAHPFRSLGYSFDVPVLPDGSYAPTVPGFAGKRILTPEGKDGDANGAVIKELIERGKLLAKGTLRHSYPHSWRSKAPVIFRATPQWFVAIDKPFLGSKTLRQLAMRGIEETKWYPPRGQNRIGAMVEGRPDWVLSRQRAWGVPLAIFVEKASGKILNDAAVFQRIEAAFEAEGADAWFTSPPERFLGEGRKAEDFEQITDILDVWFDSGSTHVFTFENPIDPHWPKVDKADLYLEGSDQHRGWFQSSLLESVGTRGSAPYKGVLTHGFVLDEQGRKMSKSLGNTLAPQVIAEKHGADILRLWAASSDFTEDLRIGQDILNANVDAYRRLRNTVRFMLANLSGFSEKERIDYAKMPELERFMLAKLAELDEQVRAGYAAYDFNRVTSTLFSFCTNELSAFYFDIRKDALYCDPLSSTRRRACRTVLHELFMCLTAWLAPILCFTMEEAWLSRFPGEEESVHLQLFPDTPAQWKNPALIEKWKRLRDLRRVVTGALELERAAKKIGSSLEAAPALHVSDESDAELLASVPFEEVAITSGFKVLTGILPESAFQLPDVKDVAAVAALASGRKCSRCWRVLPEVGKTHPDLCNRCDDAMAKVPA